ncbi:hypothetical protein AB0F72_09260 [Actinoplanes sp. NPDC023936]|uniref:hypothetical protein n=1 Tax=Actinoplanes sp. NPDC023936 TaxID=3154910 RepID=UPI0033F41A06
MTSESNYLIWSNKQNAWWGPGGKYYVQDMWEAGRIPLDYAEALCRIRTWKPGAGTPPPEVAVQAPESYLPLETYEQIEAAEVQTRVLVEQLTRKGMQDRVVEAAR